MIDIKRLPLSHLDRFVWRIIPSRCPQINLFEEVSSPEDWNVLYEVESLTNPRLREQTGDISLIAPEDRVYGSGSSWIMAAFTHPPVDGFGGRFNRNFGMYYCSADEKVSIAESAGHQQRFLADSGIQEMKLEMRVIRARLGPASLHDLLHLSGGVIFDPEDFTASQSLGYALKSARSYGVHYLSVRTEGDCFGIMRPNALSGAHHWRYLIFRYQNGRFSGVESDPRQPFSL